jgi:hypothetical protein
MVQHELITIVLATTASTVGCRYSLNSYTNYGHRTLGRLAGHPLKAAAISGKVGFYTERVISFHHLATAAASSLGLPFKLKLQEG